MVWIERAARDYTAIHGPGWSRESLDQLIRDGALSVYSVAGSKRYYLSESELERLRLAPPPSAPPRPRVIRLRQTRGRSF